MTAGKTHYMALQDGDATKIEAESQATNPTKSRRYRIQTLDLKGDQSLSVHLTNEEAVILGTALFRIVG
jgi:hypothetical protein